jgi:hypothetical protein
VRGLRASLALLLLACGASGAGAAAPRPLVKNVNGWLTALAMDGAQVAYATQADAPTNCDKVFTWNVASRAGVLVSGPKAGSCGDDEPHGQRVVQVAIAGSRVAWIRNITGNTESDDTLFAASVPKPNEKLVASATRTGNTDGGPLKGGWIAGLTGSGAVLAVNTWTTNGAGGVTKAWLKSVGASHLTAIAAGAGTLVAASADTGRIAVARSNGSVAIYSASGSVLRTIKPSSEREIALRKDYLVVLTKTKTLEIYNSRTGKFIRKWAVPGGAANLDVSSNIAVFSVWRKLYALQLTSGKLAVLAQPKRAVVAAEIETPGVVYAYNSIRGIKEVGNIAFVPLRTVVKAVA